MITAKVPLWNDISHHDLYQRNKLKIHNESRSKVGLRTFCLTNKDNHTVFVIKIKCYYLSTQKASKGPDTPCRQLAIDVAESFWDVCCRLESVFNSVHQVIQHIDLTSEEFGERTVWLAAHPSKPVISTNMPPVVKLHPMQTAVCVTGHFRKLHRRSFQTFSCRQSAVWELITTNSVHKYVWTICLQYFFVRMNGNETR